MKIIKGFLSELTLITKALKKWKWKWQSLSHVWLFVILWTIQSMEFSRPESWNGKPFPSPGDLPNPGIEPRSPTLLSDSLPAEPQGKPRNTGVGSLLLLQGNLPNQESNWNLLHSRWILYQLSHQGSPKWTWGKTHLTCFGHVTGETISAVLEHRDSGVICNLSYPEWFRSWGS